MRRSKQELLAEFNRLYDVLEVALDILEQLYPNDELFNETVISRATLLASVNARESTASEILSGTQQAVNDIALGFVGAKHFLSERQRTFLEQYETRTGRSFVIDAGKPLQQANAILKSGSLKEDADYYLLKEVLSNADDFPLTPRQTACALELLTQFEEDIAP